MNKILTTVLALAVASVTMVAQAQGIKGNAANGERRNSMCVGCHGIVGYQATFPVIYKVPMIAGQNEKYIIAALTAYQKGDRKHPTMRGVATSLSDQEIADLAAFYSQNGKQNDKSLPTDLPKPSSRVANFLRAGDCVSCHGANFSSKDQNFPKLAGQHASYLQNALAAYLVDGAPLLARGNPTMGDRINKLRANMIAEKGAAKGAKEFADLYKETAAYIASLPSDMKVLTEANFRFNK